MVLRILSTKSTPLEAYTVVVWACMHKYGIYIDGIEKLVYKVYPWAKYVVVVQVVLVDRWSLYTGDPCTRVVLVDRWSLYTGGPYRQVVLVHGWS